MKLERCLQKGKLYLLDDDGNTILETGIIGAEFVIAIYTDKPITITKELDKSLYENLNSLFENEYIFYRNLSFKDKNTITWVSDQSYDIDDVEQIQKVNRLIFEKNGEQIKLSGKNIFCQNNNISSKSFVIAFSPAGNGLYSKNVESGLSFQDDVVIAFNKTLRNEFNKPKVKSKLKK